MQEWIFDNTVCQLFYAMTGLNWFTAVFTLTVLSADRYVAVCHALESTIHRTPKLALTVSAGIWLVSLAVVTPVYLYAKTVCHDIQYVDYYNTCLIIDSLCIQDMKIQNPNTVPQFNKKDGYRQQNVRQRQKLISIIDYDVYILEYLQPFWRFSTSNNGLTLKSGYGVLQGH